MVLDAASKAAVEGVLRAKCGVRTLFEQVILALLAYFVSRDMPPPPPALLDKLSC